MSISTNPRVTFTGPCDDCGKQVKRTLPKREIGNVETGLHVRCRGCGNSNHLREIAD